MGISGIIRFRGKPITEHPYEYLVDLLVGQTLPKRYRILSLLGKNRFFAYYKAVYEPVDQVVMLRLIRSNACRDEYNYRRFQQEIRRLAGITHQNIASVMDFGVVDEGLPYIIQEYLHGSSLEDVLYAVKRISADRTLFVGRSVASALAHAHEHGLYHEVLTPADIHVVRDKDQGDMIKVSGFAMASLLSKLGVDMRDPLEKVDAIGSANYLSPEQCASTELDGRSDIYSLGAILYECLAGQPPFVNPSASEVIKMHQLSRYPSLSMLRNETKYPPYLVEIIDRCLQREPTARYQYARFIEEDLINRRGPSEREKKVVAVRPAVVETAVNRATARVKESSQSTMLPLLKVTGVFAAVVLLCVASWGLMSFASRFANEGAWKSAVEESKKDYFARKFVLGVEQAEVALKEAEKFAQPDLRVAVTLNELAAGQVVLGWYSLALENLKRALEIEKNTASDPRTKARTHQLVADAELGLLNFDSAEKYARSALQLWQQVADAKPVDRLPSYISLFNALSQQRKHQDAKLIYDSARNLVAGSTDLPEQLSGNLRESLAMMILRNGEGETAEHILKELLSSRQTGYGLKDPLTAHTLVLLGLVYHEQGNLEQAQTALENAFGILKDSYGEETPATAEVPGLLAAVQEQAGNLDMAEKNYRKSLEMHEKIYGERSPEMVRYIGALGKFLRDRRKQANAAEVYEGEIREIRAMEQKTTATTATP